MSKPRHKSDKQRSAKRSCSKQRRLPSTEARGHIVSSQFPREVAPGGASFSTAVIPRKPEQPESAAAATAKPRARNRKPVRIGDALRQRGFDEHTIAGHYVDVAHRLKGKSDKSGGVEKLLVDVLKECSKHLEPARPPERADERGAAVHVHLVHSVRRPARGACDRFVSAKRDSSGQTTPLRMTARSGSDGAANGGDADVAESEGNGGEESDSTWERSS